MSSYYHHKKYQIDEEEMAKIDNLFATFDEAKLGRINYKDARLILRDLVLQKEIVDEIAVNSDPEKKGVVEYDSFVEAIRFHYSSSSARKEMTMIFDRLRTLGGSSERAKIEQYKAGKRKLPATLNISELTKAARAVQEEFSVEDLHGMLEFADPGRTNLITLEQFIRVMKKSSIW